MANDHVKMFTEEYSPIAMQVSRQTGIAPSVLLAQWGMESDYGRRPTGHFNFGNIKDLSGKGKEGVDNQTGSKDKYLNFESPEAFGDYYAHMMRRLYPNALNSGSDISKYAEGLRTGIKGSYAEDENYEDKVRGAYQVTSGFYKDPDELPTVRPPTQAEQIKQEREERGETDDTNTTPPKTEVVSPATAAAVGAATTTLGQVPFAPTMPEKVPDLSNLEDAADKAKRRADIAEQRLRQRTTSAMPIAGGTDLPTLEAEYKRSQFLFQQAEQELQAAMAAQKAKLPPTPAPSAPEVPTAPQIITDPNAPVQTSQERILQGKIDPTTGNTGRQNMVFNEVTSWEANERELQQKALQEAQRAGLIPDTGQQVRSQFGKPSGTKSGILVPPDVAEPLNRQAELDQRIADDKAAQERLHQQQEMQRLKNERALAAQQQSQAQAALTQAQRAKTSGVTRAQTAAETAADRAAAAQADLAAGRVTASTAPGALARPMEVTGVKTAKAPTIVKGGLGALGGYEAATGANTLANIPVQELMKRFNSGDRSPELLQALAQATGAIGQTVAGGAAMLPAMGPKTARIKGAGTIGTLGLGAYQAYQALQNEAAKEPTQ
jgi:hypothetical protein